MSAPNFTPIQVYRSATPGAVPLAGNLAAGELALNTADQKLFFKNAGGTVVNIDTANGTVTSVSGTGTVNGITLTGTVTSSGSLTLGGTLSGVSLTSQVSGTLPVANGGTGVTSSTGTVAVVLSNTPTLVTPILGVASATSIATGLGLVGTPAYTFTGDLNTGMWSPAADTVAVSTGGAEAMRINSVSLVGIGTTAPVGRLMVAATDTSNTIGSATASINITNIDAGAFGRTSNLNFTVDDGNLTSRRLATISAVYTGFSGGSTAGALVFATQFDGSLSERMRIVEAGGVGIGTSTPAYQLQLSADSAAKPTSSLWTIASDSRVKTETGEYTKGLDAVCALRPITYHYNGAAGFTADGKENISIIAQEAIQHFPECVGTFEALLNEGDEEKTELFNWNGHALTFALVNAVKELKAVNDALTARVAQLEGNQP